MVVFVEHVVLGRGFGFRSDLFLQGALVFQVDEDIPQRGIGVFGAGGASQARSHISGAQIARALYFVLVVWLHSSSPS